MAVPVMVAIWAMLRTVFGTQIPRVLAVLFKYRWFVLGTTLMIGTPLVDGVEKVNELLAWFATELDAFFDKVAPAVKQDLGGGYSAVARGAALMNCVIALDVYGQVGVALLGAFLSYAALRLVKFMWSLALNLLKGIAGVVKSRR